jgi:hypothetical protein
MLGFQTDNRRIDMMRGKVRRFGRLRLFRWRAMAALGVLAFAFLGVTRPAGAGTVASMSAQGNLSAAPSPASAPAPLLYQPASLPDCWPGLSVVETSPDCKTFEVYGANYIAGDMIHVVLYDSGGGLGVQVGSAEVQAQTLEPTHPGGSIRRFTSIRSPGTALIL